MWSSINQDEAAEDDPPECQRLANNREAAFSPVSAQESGCKVTSEISLLKTLIEVFEMKQGESEGDLCNNAAGGVRVFLDCQ